MRSTVLPLSLSAVVLTLCAAALPAQRLSRGTTELVPDAVDPLFQPVLADIDGDGMVDLAAGRQVTLNRFGRFVPAPVGVATGFDIALVADFDGDALPDIVDVPISPISGPVGLSLSRQPFGYVRRVVSTREAVAIAAADFDGDGDLDLVTAPFFTGDPTQQFANDGFGNFTEVTALRMPAQTFAAAERGLFATDLDADGDPDLLVVTRNGTPRIQAFFNQGGGVFAPPVAVGVPAVFGTILGLVDVDGDGDDDLFVTGGECLLNQGGTFVSAAVQPLPRDFSARFVRAADIDNDGDLDLWYELADPAPSRWFENVGPGVPFVDRGAGSAPVRRNAQAIVLTDTDGDGFVDVLAASERLEVLLGQPGGRFVDATPLDPIAAAYCDFDRDGIADQLVVRGGPSLWFRSGDGTGGFVERPAAPGWAIRAVLGQTDVDGDGDTDLLVTLATPDSVPVIVTQDGRGNFTVAAGAFSSGFTDVRWHAFADVDGDGDPDLIASTFDPARRRAIRLFRNDGSGSLTHDPQWAVGALVDDAKLTAAIDVDADGDVDLVTGGDDPLLLRNDGAANFTADPTAIPGRFASTGIRPSEIVPVDIDGDGDLDLVVGYYPVAPNPSVHPQRGAVFVNDGAGRFAAGPVFEGGDVWIRVHVVDIDLDDRQDLVVSLDRDFQSGDYYRVVRWIDVGRGNPRLATMRVEGVSSLLFGSFVDVDLDGDADFVGGFERRSVLLNRRIDLRARFVPRVGGLLEFVVTEWAFRALVLVSAGRLATPLALPGLGLVTVDPALGDASLVSVRNARGELPLALTLPNDPALVGLDVFAQALLDPGASSARLTNAIQVPIAF